MDKILYYNNLNIENFIHMLDDTSECYKFYWLDSILDILASGKNTMEFDEIMNGMIADAWYSVSEYHLNLGTRDSNGNSRNALEKAVKKLMAVSSLKSNASREEIINEIKKNDTLIHKDKMQLADMVPYRLLSTFFDLKGNDPMWGHKERLRTYANELNKRTPIPYIYGDSKGLKLNIQITEAWENMMLDHMVLIKGWIEIKKVRYLQARNPGVPGIIYKLAPETERIRKLKNARKLWDSVMKRTSIYDIYLGKPINSKYEMDHFVPWSYIANDELWNLMPMDSSLNSSKSNKLPKWDDYFVKFAENQYIMYQNVHQDEKLMDKFKKCYRDNIVSLWANEELYIKGNDKERFTNILHHNMKPVYDSARVQGYSIWNFM